MNHINNVPIIIRRVRGVSRACGQVGHLTHENSLFEFTQDRSGRPDMTLWVRGEMPNVSLRGVKSRVPRESNYGFRPATGPKLSLRGRQAVAISEALGDCFSALAMTDPLTPPEKHTGKGEECTQHRLTPAGQQ